MAAIAFGLLGLGASGGDAWAKRAKPAKDASAVADDGSGDGNASKKTSAPASRAGVPRGVTLNACGCYHTGNSCVYTNRNAKCDCPEDCEPVGCEERRQKELDREIATETKRAQDAEKTREDAEAARVKKENEAMSSEAEGESDSDEGDAEGLPDPTLQKTAEKAAERAPDSKTPDKAATAKPGAQKAAFKATPAKTSKKGKERANTKKVAAPTPATP